MAVYESAPVTADHDAVNVVAVAPVTERPVGADGTAWAVGADVSINANEMIVVSNRRKSAGLFSTDLFGTDLFGIETSLLRGIEHEDVYRVVPDFIQRNPRCRHLCW